MLQNLCLKPAADTLLPLLFVALAGRLSRRDASAVLMGCARLAVRPGKAIIGACWAAVEQEGGSGSWMVASAAWALAVMEVRWSTVS